MITTPEEYMNRLANIQNQGGVSVVTIDPQNEPHFIIDADTRVITVPSAFTFWALKATIMQRLFISRSTGISTTMT